MLVKIQFEQLVEKFEDIREGLEEGKRYLIFLGDSSIGELRLWKDKPNKKAAKKIDKLAGGFRLGKVDSEKIKELVDERYEMLY